jgi:hypothetical protein
MGNTEGAIRNCFIITHLPVGSKALTTIYIVLPRIDEVRTGGFTDVCIIAYLSLGSKASEALPALEASCLKGLDI